MSIDSLAGWERARMVADECVTKILSVDDPKERRELGKKLAKAREQSREALEHVCPWLVGVS